MKTKKPDIKVATPSDSGLRVAALAAALANAPRPADPVNAAEPVIRKRGRPPKNGFCAQAKMPKRKPGRPANPEKLSITERTALYDKAIVKNGGRVLNRLRLDNEANTALQIVLKDEGSIRSSMKAALLHYAKVLAKKSNTPSAA